MNPMCRRCRLRCPAYYMTGRICEDCRLAAISPLAACQLESSPSGIGIGQLRLYGVRLKRRFLRLKPAGKRKRPPTLSDAERLHL